ncbi:1,2-phenylacetyl-CoA epoxidase subunit PaaD [Corynebacterium sp. 32222D000AT]|uniref:1,2-phenylacetyl-CoA epoxidase subunit PaaD n=1 Tax=unclassified Corynebacterium TaxID=2624378 RepID=UPI002A97BBB5|nr:phenylacetate-CoA oxygenase subunit PaaJ [Mycobacteriaceae bacterium]MDY5829247.1 1,2-phenylacetyl-CoA epoxidase subunit PaaD [Corynebacterium sp.]
MASQTPTNQPAHPLRPADPEAARVWDVAAQVPDPEIPVISIADLGILRAATLEGETAVVTITPTYSGCPAMEHITTDIVRALEEAGYSSSRVDLVLDPAWTTDWITERGKQNLRDYGIAPPTGQSRKANDGPIPLTLAPPPAIECPHCGSRRTQKLAQFGSTSCKALYNCQDCLEPFDYFKVH